jgi:hypothetical protein
MEEVDTDDALVISFAVSCTISTISSMFYLPTFRIFSAIDSSEETTFLDAEEDAKLEEVAVPGDDIVG